MTKTIKLKDEVYTKLETFRGKRETFSESIDRLLTMLDKVGELRNILEGQLNFEKHKQAQRKDSTNS